MDQVKSATRTLEVLGHFAQVRAPLALKDLCETLGYPQSSMTVLLKTLTLAGYLNYDRSRRLYLPTTMVTSLGDWVPDSLFGGPRPLELLSDLLNATGETVILAVRNDIYVEYVATLDSPNPLRFEVNVGSLRPVHQSPIGWLLLSIVSRKEAEKLMARSIEATPGIGPDFEFAMERVEEARHQDYIYGANTPFVGGSTLAMLLPQKPGLRRFALGCGGVLERMAGGLDEYLVTLRSIIASYADA